MIFDSHAHYDDKSFDIDRENLLKMFPKKEIFRIINVGVDIESSQKSIELSEKYDYIYSAVGVHPQNVENIKNSFVDVLDKLSENKKVIAVGEIGLDYHYNSQNKLLQKEIFVKQLQFAKEKNLPVCVHDRDAHRDIFEIICKFKPKGVLHCFSGDVGMAKEIIKIGMKIGVGGVVTFKNAKKLVEVVQNIDLNDILLESDAPYLAPEPFRGKRCDSSQIRFVVDKIAEIKSISAKKVMEITKSNAMQLFNFS
jgi:TatD DNase family protein